ncbi:MAG: hypothetical protein CMO55_01295 [Verrucomicrobiales bacterium]|nr:hypothetical protein [Verrucomicrobiales bacterium]
MIRTKSPFLFSLFWIAACIGSFLNAAEESVTFTVPPGEEMLTSADGVLSLSWESAGDGVIYELEQSVDDSFTNPTMRYSGPDVGSYLTGLAEGDYFFRVRAKGGEWSEPLRAKVTFIDRRVLWILLVSGFVVVAATVGTILTGWRKTES